MPVPSDTAIFYAVFIAPGFIAVMTVISLAAIEDDYSSFVLLVWSLVASLVIDTVFLAVYQWRVSPIESFDELPEILFDPHFQALYVLGILFSSVLVGIVAAVGILLDVPGWFRRMLQAKSSIQVNPRQPWANFMRGAGWVRIKTQDDQLFMGTVSEWSRAGRSKELWIENPQRYNSRTQEFEPVDAERDAGMLFLEKDIDRTVMVTEDGRLSFWKRVGQRWKNRRTIRDRWHDRRSLRGWWRERRTLRERWQDRRNSDEE
ncbi:DUF6338 family protein [Halomontanus rarus]|uniref:DUF6338 family protein n=1 Tax=Halomontanus rarus TaxID=3034020 RepID=UPI001A981248